MSLIMAGIRRRRVKDRSIGPLSFMPPAPCRTLHIPGEDTHSVSPSLFVSGADRQRTEKERHDMSPLSLGGHRGEEEEVMLSEPRCARHARCFPPGGKEGRTKTNLLP